MYLLLAILLFSFVGFLLFAVNPLLAGIIGFAIIAGSLFRIIDLLNDLSNRLSNIAPKTDKVRDTRDALERYLEERDATKQE
jgi:large-conductance mechanosensitive channel